MVRQLEAARVPITKIEVNPAKQQTIDRKMGAYLASDKNLKDSAQRAFNSYVKSVYLMKNKAVFNVESIDLTRFAESLGLSAAPRVRFLEKQRKQKQNPKEKLSDPEVMGTVSKIPEKTEENYSFAGDNGESDEEVFTVKRKDHAIDYEDVDSSMDPVGSRKDNSKALTKAQIAKKIVKKNIIANTKMTFDETGEAIDDATKQKVSDLGKEYEVEIDNRLGGGIDIKKAKEILVAEDKFDKVTERARIREKHKEDKRKKKEENRRLAKKATEDSDESGSEDEGSEPDLSWLPDPDKVYGKCEDEEDGDADTSVSENVSPPGEKLVQVKQNKRKLTVITKVVPKKNARHDFSEDEDGEDVDVMDTGLSLGEDEDLAMQLLSR